MLLAAPLSKIDRENLRIDTDRVREGLQTVRRNVSRDRWMLSYLAWWERIVQGNDMRNLSPLWVLFTEDERLQFLEDFWAQWSLR